MEPYINIKSLFLEGNVIEKIENISHLHNLRGLYLQHNMIKEISSDSFAGLNELTSLDLSNNQIRQIKNISHLQCLETLNLENNYSFCHYLFVMSVQYHL